MKKDTQYLEQLAQSNPQYDFHIAAFDYNLLILAEKEITHNADVTAPNNIITSNNEKEFSSILKEIYNNKEKFKNRLIYQHKHAGAMSPSEFKKIFKK
ncbi:hypothetical protein [Staphylococcus hominis]